MHLITVFVLLSLNIVKYLFLIFYYIPTKRSVQKLTRFVTKMYRSGFIVNYNISICSHILFQKHLIKTKK